MSKLVEFLKNKWLYIVAFCTPWLIVMVVSVVNDGWPFGSGSMLSGDTLVQLLPFAREIWEKVHTGDSLSYTWNAVGGIDFFSILGYYISPFTLLILVVPKSNIADMLQIVLVLKWSCIAVSMVYFFYNTKYNTLKVNKKLISLFLGLSFALSSSQINFIRYIQFSDVIICFPILLILIEKMVESKKWLLYCIILAFSIISNTYISYQVCIFLVIWFFFQYDKDTEEKFKKFMTFAGSSILSATIASWFIIKGLLLSTGRLRMNSDISSKIEYAKSSIIYVTDFIRQLFIFSPINSPYRTEPNVYFSVICTILVFLIAFINIDKMKKIYIISGLLFMLLSFFNGGLSLFWHIFNKPNGMFHRFSYIFIFLMLFVVMLVLIHFEEIRTKHIAIIGTIVVIGFFYTFFDIEVYDSTKIYITTMFLIAIYLFLLVMYTKKSISYKNILVILIILGMTELLSNSYVLIDDYYNMESIREKEFYEETGISAYEEAEIEPGERISTSTGYDNAGLYSSKSSISGFISSINGDMFSLMGRLGMGITGNVEYTLKGGSPLINLLFNIRYIVANTSIDTADTERESSYLGSNLYRTNRIAGLGYVVDKDICEWNPYDKTCFECQNSFVKLSTGAKEDIFTVINPDVKCVDILNNEIKRDESYIENNAYVYNYNSSFGNENDSIQVEFTADEDMDLYVDARSSFSGRISTLIDDELIGKDSDGFLRSTIHVGNVSKGQKISLVAVGKEDYYMDEEISVFFRFAKFNEDVYSGVYEKLSRNTYNIETMKSDYIKGSINADEDGIMMTSIQSDVGFDVYVDGDKTEYETIGGALIGVPLKKGEHMVEFRYVDTTPIYAKAMSVSGIVVYVILMIITFFRKKRDNNVLADTNI